MARRSVARAVIIEAGRRMALRDGTDELSLSAVAAEASFNPSTVFGHFRNKDELLLAIVAEDLGVLAALMHASSADMRPLDLVPPPKTDDAPPRESPWQDEDRGSLPETESDPSDWARSAGATEKRPAATDEAGVDRGPPQRATVDLWLERRLRIFERAVSDLEHRLEDTNSAATRASALAEETAKTLFERMEAFEREHHEMAQALSMRIEETERRQRGATAEMRAAVNDAATRIEILEAARRTDHNIARKSEVSLEESAAFNQVVAVSHGPVNDVAEQEAYHAAAQRAASAAALLAGMRDRSEKLEAQRNRVSTKVRFHRKHYVLAACLLFLAFAVGAFAAFYAGEARGRLLTASRAVLQSARTSPSRRARSEFAATSSADSRARVGALARAGSAKAELLFGLQFLHGDGLAPNQPEGARWVRLAAGQHDPVAQYYLGSLYEHGDGVIRDNGDAIGWYEAAARQGNRKAMHALGIAYAQGEGIKKDYSQAARWFTEAAEFGLVNSQFNLAVLYERGLGVRPSLIDAYKWYAVAAASGDQESRKRLDALKTQLSAGDLAAGERAAHAFTPKKDNPAANNPPVLADLLSRQSR